jgi:transcriptional regulator with XRE-family HTH domain
MPKIGRPPKSQRSAFGERIEFLRKQAKLTQREVAAALDISQSAYVKWERRDIGLSEGRLQKLASIFGVEVKDFFSTQSLPRCSGGSIGRVKRLFDFISQLPRHQQKKIISILEPFVLNYVGSKKITGTIL